MKTKKFALLVGTLFLVGNIVLPTLVAAATQEGTLLISNGTKEIYYNGYGGAGINGFEMIGADGFNLQARAFQQDAFSRHSTDTAPWTDVNQDAFIGVADFTNASTAWNLQAQVDPLFTATLNDNIALTDVNFKMATAASGVWGATVTLTDNKSTQVVFKNKTGTATTNDVYYYVTDDSTYVPGATDFVAPLNVDHTVTSLDAATTYSTGIRTVQNILVKNNIVNATPGIFGFAVNYYHPVAAGTPADTYTTNVTYTLL